MLTTGDQFPNFQMTGVISNQLENAFTDINEQTYKGKWLIVFFWPKDFTFVCPTEIQAFGQLNQNFLDRNTQVLGVSTDSEFVHLAWRQSKKELNDLPFPMLSDINRKLSTNLGILDTEKGVAKRATFIVDPEGMIRFSMVTDLNVGRNPEEVLRVLDALQTNALCPCNWQQGEKTLDPLAENIIESSYE